MKSYMICILIWNADFAKRKNSLDRKDFCYELRESGNRPFDFSNRCPLQAPFVLFVDFQHVILIKDHKRNVWQRKIDNQRSVSQRVFPSKNALQSKSLDLYSPGEFSDRWSETHLHKRKKGILRFRAKRELSSNLPPKRKNRPEDRSVENFENGGG